MPERKLIVELIGDSDSLERAMGRSSKSVDRFAKDSTRSLTGFQRQFATVKQATRSPLVLGFAGAGGALGLSALIAEGREAADVAVNLGEQTNKVRVIFGESAPEIEAWGKTTADSIGIANDQALAAVGTFGNLFNVVGLAPARASEMSRALVQLAADLASFNNASPEEVLDAIRSGLIGEAEPLRRYGVLLSEARVQQQALADTGKTNIKTLTDQEKAVARYELILRDTVRAQGDFARTSDSIANKQRVLSANVRDAQAALGRGLLPILNLVTVGLLDAAEAVEALTVGLERLAKVQLPGGGGTIGDYATKIFLASNPATASLYRLHTAIQLLRGDGGEIPVHMRGEEEITAALNTVDALRDAVADPLRIVIGVDVHGLAEATSEIESLRSLARQPAPPVTPPPRDTGAERERESTAQARRDLRLDQAAAQGLRAELAENRRQQALVQQQIEVKGHTVELDRQLFELQKRENQIIADLAQASKDRAASMRQARLDALQASIDAAGYRVSLLESRGQLRLALAALEDEEKAVRAQIAVSGRTLDLQRDLERIRRERHEIRERIAQAERDARTRQQFRTLGLTEEGEEPVPGVASLSKRTAALTERLRDANKLTPKVLATLQNIGKVLAQGANKVGRDVRAAIDRMLDDIAAPLKDTTGKRANQFKKVSFDILEGLGLTPEQIRELRARISQIGPGGTVPVGGTSAFGMPTGGGAPIPPTATTGTFVINIHGDVVTGDADEFLKQMQRKARRTRASRRGVRPGVNRGGV